MNSIFLAHQIFEGSSFIVLTILLGLMVLLPVILTKKLKGSDPAAYLALSLFLIMAAVMIIVGGIFQKYVPVILGVCIGILVSAFIITFATKWSKE